MLPLAAAASEEISGPVRVVDADTWDVGGVRVRLHGIDAPEMDQTCQSREGADWSCGVWATDKVRRAYEGRTARCRPLDRDRYGRTVARCEVAGEDVGRTLVEKGLAFAFRKYSGDYVSQERVAMAEKSGLHSGTVQAPWLFRAAGGAAKAPSDCRIKGNISAEGERIYHVPGQRHYARTQINPKKGERWFCSAAEAREAGWRAARR
nr:thermonuclease family protein [Ruegeria sediminis]